MTTGWPQPVLAQDGCRQLFEWFASKPEARRLVRERAANIRELAMETQMPEELNFANERPQSLDDDLYAWSMEAEAMIRRLHARVQELEGALAAMVEYFQPYACGSEDNRVDALKEAREVLK